MHFDAHICLLLLIVYVLPNHLQPKMLSENEDDKIFKATFILVVMFDNDEVADISQK